MKPTISDQTLRDSVAKELESDPEVVATYISVAAADGAVTLRGHVATYHEKHVAVRAAERVPAVRAIADEVEVREPSLHERADDEIAAKIAELRGRNIDSPDSVAVQVRDGRVVLHGTVGSEAERDAVERAAHGLVGVRAVDNLIEVESPSQPADSLN